MYFTLNRDFWELSGDNIWDTVNLNAWIELDEIAAQTLKRDVKADGPTVTKIRNAIFDSELLFMLKDIFLPRPEKPSMIANGEVDNENSEKGGINE